MAEPVTNVLGIVGIKHCGEYDATKNYEKLNVVTYNGSSYCAKTSTTGNLPTNTTYWDLMAEKGDKGDTGEEGYTPVKGTDYYTAEDKAELETTLSSDVTTEVTSQLGSLTSATPLVASSTADMTDTTRIYVNTTDGHWYWYNGSSWTDGGIYQSTGLGDEIVKLRNLNNDVLGNLFKYEGQGSYSKLNIDFGRTPVTNVRLKGSIFVEEYEDNVYSNPSLLVQIFTSYNPETGIAYAYKNVTNNYKVNDFKNGYVEFDLSLEEVNWQDFNAVSFFFNSINSAANAKYYIKNLEIYADNTKIDNLNCSSTYEGNHGSKLTLIIKPLATQEYVDNSEKEVLNKIKDIEETISNVTNYDSLSKSTLKKIACWGDSITEGGSAGEPWPTVLQSLIDSTNVTVINKGRSGETSGTIAFRQGANKITCSESFTIPATITESEQFQFECSSGYKSNLARLQLQCVINGIEGMLKLSIVNQDSSYATFTRTYEGEETIVPANSEFIYSDANKFNNCLSIIWVGRNDMAFSWPYQITGTIDNIESIVNNLKTDIKRFLVISCTTANSEIKDSQKWTWIKDLNNNLKIKYPFNFVNIQEYLSTTAIYDADITPTQEDLTAIENETIPPSLLADGLHPNAIAKQLIAQYIYNSLDSKGWIL